MVKNWRRISSSNRFEPKLSTAAFLLQIKRTLWSIHRPEPWALSRWSEAADSWQQAQFSLTISYCPLQNIYIYIYIYLFVCVCVCVCTVMIHTRKSTNNLRAKFMDRSLSLSHSHMTMLISSQKISATATKKCPSHEPGSRSTASTAPTATTSTFSGVPSGSCSMMQPAIALCVGVSVPS